MKKKFNKATACAVVWPFMESPERPAGTYSAECDVTLTSPLGSQQSCLNAKSLIMNPHGNPWSAVSPRPVPVLC